MNPIALVFGGVLVGVLLALSLISRYPVKTDKTTTPVEIESVTKPSNVEGSHRVKSPSLGLKPVPALSLFGNVGQKSSSADEIPKSSAVSIHSATSVEPVKETPVAEAVKPSPPPRTIRWAPGKEGEFSKIKAKSDTTASVSPAADPVVETVPDLSKNISPAKLRKDYLRAQRKRHSVATAMVETEVSVTSVPMNVSASRVTDVPNPFVPYHSQASTDFNSYKAYIPTLEIAKKRVSEGKVKALPDMSKQKGILEKDNLKLHMCNGVFEAYSASYLTTKQHMLNVASETYNLTWVNCEMASFIHMKESNRFYNNPQSEGVVIQSLDVLDFSVIHLSAFERSSRKYKDQLWPQLKGKERDAQWKKIPEVVETGKRLAALNDPKSPSYRKIHYSIEAQRTVVIMPMLVGAMGAGHSELKNRLEYIKTCFWSFYEFIPNIVAGVTHQNDSDWCMNESGLPFYDVIVLPPLPKGAGLPVGTTQQVKMRLLDGRYDFDYIFFTESDQILISRELQLMYEHLKVYPGHMVLPHRLMPYSSRVIGEIHKRDYKVIKENEWMQQSCCLPRQNCVERKTWINIKNPGVPVIDYYGLYVPLGNVNFLDEQYRSCKLTSYIGDYCP